MSTDVDRKPQQTLQPPELIPAPKGAPHEHPAPTPPARTSRRPERAAHPRASADRQVAHRAGATDHEIDTVLRRMKQVHTGIVTGLHHTT